jgi:hypothetical protein
MKKSVGREKMKIVISFIIFILALVVPLLSYANWGGSTNIGSFGAGHLEARGTNEVELLNEDLHIDLYKDHATVVVEYTFQNTGNDVLVKAGFPDIIYNGENEIDDYRIVVDGSQMSYKHIKGGEFKYIPLPNNLTMRNEDEKGDGKIRISWLVSAVQFKKGEKKKVRISYTSHYQMSTGGWSDDTDYDSETFRYLLSTGAAWKGPIKSGLITITAVSIDPNTFHIKPAGKFERKNNTFTWQFENLKPSRADDIVIDFNDPVSIKMIYSVPEDKFGQSFYSLNDKQNKYYYVFHSYTAQASSTLKPEDKYVVDNVKDMKIDTAWCKGKEGDGLGEYILLKLNEPTTVSQIGIIPAYAKSKETYFNNNRIAQITAIINGSYTVTPSIQDEYVTYGADHPKAYQYIDIRGYNGPIKTIKLIIDKVYPGKKYHDTCISEILLQQQFESKPEAHGAR